MPLIWFFTSPHAIKHSHLWWGFWSQVHSGTLLQMFTAALFDSDSCSENGTLYSNHHIWSPAPCRVCICDMGIVVCEDEVCEELIDCQTSVTPVGECCPVCSTAAPPHSTDTEAGKWRILLLDIHSLL